MITWGRSQCNHLVILLGRPTGVLKGQPRLGKSPSDPPACILPALLPRFVAGRPRTELRSFSDQVAQPWRLENVQCWLPRCSERPICAPRLFPYFPIAAQLVPKSLSSWDLPADVNPTTSHNRDKASPITARLIREKRDIKRCFVVRRSESQTVANRPFRVLT